MYKKLLSCLIIIIISYQLLSANVIATGIWQAKDIKDNYKNKYFCNLTISESACNNNITNITKLSGINIDNFADKNINEVTLDKISYYTTNTFPATGEITSKVSGLLMMPNTNKPKGIILYYHPTVFNNSGIPSNFKSKNITTQMFDNLYAAIYALNGYIVVAPDYIGQGIDYSNYHPYVFYPKQTVNSAIDLLNSSANIIREKYNLSSTTKINFFSAGYSEGGAYSIWTAKCFENEKNCPNVSKLDTLYNYIAAAGLAGAYDISNITLNFLIDNNNVKEYKLHNKSLTTMLKPALVTNAMIGYLFYSNIGKTISINDFDKNFFNMDCTFQFLCNINGKQYNLQDIFKLKRFSEFSFVLAIFYNSIYRKYPQKSASHYYFPSGNNSMYDLFNKETFKDHELIQTMKDADIIDYGKTTTTPLFLFSLKEDSVVTVLNYDKFMKDANDNVTGFTLDNKQIIATSILSWIPFTNFNISDVDHISGEIYANIFAYKYIDDMNKVYL
ncbi:alpha/beta hydrolase family protein [Francisella sciaenopsi]|uniref:Lysophospholipase n=1 Tax=Francisella sciaenopsi TaxID=3055034 RepID=A0ABQ6PD61_9GAMM